MSGDKASPSEVSISPSEEDVGLTGRQVSPSGEDMVPSGGYGPVESGNESTQKSLSSKSWKSSGGLV